MTVQLLGYSERGIVNALCDDIAHSKHPLESIKNFLSWFKFSSNAVPDLSNIRSATLFVEQSFSDFGDLDLLILLDHECSARQAFLIEAKVSTDTNSWVTVGERWDEFVKCFDGDQLWDASNLFVQLYRKVRLVNFLKSDGSQPFVADLLVPRGSLGRNQVVRRASECLKECVAQGSAWFGAILPDDPDALASFANDTLHGDYLQKNLPEWNSDHFGFLSWQTVHDHIRVDDWTRTVNTFEWNKGQIFRTLPASSPLATKGSVFQQNGIYYYVVDSGRGRDCRAAILKSPDDYFWQTKLIDLRSCDPPGGVAPNLPVPILPTSGARYIWDSKEDSDRLPPESSEIQIDNGAHVIVRRASWSKTRVQSETGSPSFLVYTHHLKQFTQ